MKKIEKHYPLLLSLIISILVFFLRSNVVVKSISNDKFTKVLELSITFVTIIIGFVGAILPVLLSMRNESHIVKRIFEMDKEKLFQKYIIGTITIGLGLIVCTIIVIVGDIYKYDWIYKFLKYFWSFILLWFVFSTHRSMKYITKIVFLTDRK